MKYNSRDNIDRWYKCSLDKKVLKQLSLTKSKLINETRDKSLKDLTSSLQPNIDKNSKIKYLD